MFLLVSYCVNRKPEAVCCLRIGNLKMLNILPLVAEENANTKLPSSAFYSGFLRVKVQRDTQAQTHAAKQHIR